MLHTQKHTYFDVVKSIFLKKGTRRGMINELVESERAGEFMKFIFLHKKNNTKYSNRAAKTTT